MWNRKNARYHFFGEDPNSKHVLSWQKVSMKNVSNLQHKYTKISLIHIWRCWLCYSFFFNGEFWQTLFCCRHLLELNLRWSKFMQTGTLVIKLSPSSSSSLSWSSSSSPSLSSSPWKIAEFSRRPNDQITIDHTCRGLSEHCLSSKEKIAYRWERNYPKRNINLVRCLGGRGANIMAMTSVTLSSQLKSNFKDPPGRRPGLLTNVFLTHFIFFKDFIPRRGLGIFSHYKKISIHGRVAILLQLIESWADYNKTSLWFGFLCC